MSDWPLQPTTPGSSDAWNSPGAHSCNCQLLKRNSQIKQNWKFNTTKLFYVNYEGSFLVHTSNCYLIAEKYLWCKRMAAETPEERETRLQLMRDRLPAKPPRRERKDYSTWAPTNTKCLQLKPPRRVKQGNSSQSFSANSSQSFNAKCTHFYFCYFVFCIHCSGYRISLPVETFIIISTLRGKAKFSA